MTPRRRRIGAILALVAAGGAAYWWWMRPERQIRAILDDVAAALTYDAGESGLQVLTAITALEPHLAEDVSVQIGEAPPLEGRDAVITAGARLRRRTWAMRVRFFDPRITVSGDDKAAVAVTAEAVVTTDAGDERVEVHQVTATFERPTDRWVVFTARASPVPEPAQ